MTHFETNYLPIKLKPVKRNEENRKSWETILNTLSQRQKESLSEGPSKYVERHLARGKLAARQRINLLLDEGSPFLELCPLAGYQWMDVSIIGGIGMIAGVECLITANVPTKRGGALNEASVMKGERLVKIALENRLPVISLTETAGADLTQQFSVFHRGGGSFRNIARRSKKGIPTICIVFGSSTAGGAYNPGMSDYVIMVKDNAKVFLAGPPLVYMATGEKVDDESLGGALMHSTKSGVSDYFAHSEYEGLHMARQIVESIGWKKQTSLPMRHLKGALETPLYPMEDLLDVVPTNIRLPFDAREVIARLVDGSRFSEFKANYGKTLVTGFASLTGITIGILANNGILFSESSLKGSQFIHLCNQRNVPLLFLQNITGFMVGKKYEEQGIIKSGAHLINAVSNSGVPAITIIMGSSYGAGNYAMCGRAYKPRFLFSWPASRCSVMGESQLAGVMDMLQRSKRQMTPKESQAADLKKKMFMQRVAEQNEVYYTSSRMIDDGIIDPRDTRTILSFCLSIIHSNCIKGDNHFGVSRM